MKEDYFMAKQKKPNQGSKVPVIEQQEAETLPHQLIHNHIQKVVYTDGKNFETTDLEIAQTICSGKICSVSWPNN